MILSNIFSAQQVLNFETDLANLTKRNEDLEVLFYYYCELLLFQTERREIKSLLSLDETEWISFVDQIRAAINNLKCHSPPVSQNVCRSFVPLFKVHIFAILN